MVSPFLPQKVMTFLVFVLKVMTFFTHCPDLYTAVTTATLSAFPGHRLSTVLVNLVAKNI